MQRILLVLGLLASGCGVDEGSSGLAVAELSAPTGTFAGCIDSHVLTPQECNYTCVGGKAVGAIQSLEYCEQRGVHGDIACFCP